MGYDHVVSVGDVVVVVPVGVGSVGVAVAVAVGNFEVTVNVAAAYPPAPSVAVTVYVPGDTDGIVNAVLILPNILPENPVATTVVPKLMLTWLFELNPIPITDTDVPTGPWVGLNTKA
jgi:hypothetical protein